MKLISFKEAPTDRLFTGQRLDEDTGLYFYGARYYDPTIGRFISPDTLVQNSMNPQAFNRYSYCVNNPLKYTDPSGHKVELLYTNLEDWGYYDPLWLVIEYIDALESAWALYEEVNPSMAKGLQSASETYTIKFGLTKEDQGGTTANDQDITINYEYVGEPETAATLIAHEAVHCYIKGPYSVYEEAFALQHQGYVSQHLFNGFINVPTKIQQSVHNVDFTSPWNQLTTQLDVVEEALKMLAKDDYGNLALYPKYYTRIPIYNYKLPPLTVSKP